MACRLAGAKPLSEPMLEYCQLDHWEKLEWKLNQNLYILIHENAFENVEICGHFVSASMR